MRNTYGAFLLAVCLAADSLYLHLPFSILFLTWAGNRSLNCEQPVHKGGKAIISLKMSPAVKPPTISAKYRDPDTDDGRLRQDIPSKRLALTNSSDSTAPDHMMEASKRLSQEKQDWGLWPTRQPTVKTGRDQDFTEPPGLRHQRYLEEGGLISCGPGHDAALDASSLDQ